MEPHISVIMPVYNTAEEYLKISIESVLEQSYGNFELIIVDDGSTNNAKEVISSYKDERIKYVYQENSGQSSARNKGLKLARGKYIFFIDSDDWINFRTFSKLIRKAEEESCDILLFGSLVYDNKTKSNVVDAWLYDAYLHSFSKEGFTYQSPELLKNLFLISFACWGKLFRKDFLIDNNLFFKDSLTFEDTEYFIRYILVAPKISILPAFLYFYRKNTENSIMTKGDYKYFELLKVFKLIEETLEKYNLLEKLRVPYYEFKIDRINDLSGLIQPHLKEEYKKVMLDNLREANLKHDELKQMKYYNAFLEYLYKVKKIENANLF